MRDFMFMLFSEDEWNDGNLPHPMPRYVGFVHARDGEDPSEIINRNAPPRHKVGISEITGDTGNWMIELGYHKHITLA